MKICAVTMVYRDYWALSQWYAHYSRHLGAEHLYIVAHGHDPKVPELCPAASIITVPRESLDGFDRIRGRMLNGFQSGLAHIYDRVIRTDVDELILLDPAVHSGFDDMFDQCSSHAVFALGFDLVEQADDPELGPGENVFAKRRGAIFSGHYSKAFAVSDATELVQHGVKMARHQVTDYPFQMPQGVYLAHLKHANTAALTVSNRHRVAIATQEGRGLPGKAWRIADEIGARMAKRIETYPERSWDDAQREAFELVSQTPTRSVEDGLVRTTFHQFKFRTTLPDWFAST